MRWYSISPYSPLIWAAVSKQSCDSPLYHVYFHPVLDSPTESIHLSSTIPWGGRVRAHALGESPEGTPRDTPAGPTTNTERTRTHPKKTPKRTGTTPVPWGGRFRAHALGENPEGAPRDTPAGLTTTTQRTGNPPNKTRNTGSRRQSRPTRAL